MTAETPMASPPSILVVDDDPDIGLVLTELLEGEGHRVIVEGTGTEALDRIHRTHFDTVLLDVGLPDKDGLMVLGDIRKSNPQIPVIILSAHKALERKVGPLDLQGAFAYLTKPFNREELKSTIRKAIGLSNLACRADQTQRALRSSESRFRAVIDSAPDAIIQANQEGTIMGWNGAAESQFGYTELEVLGKPLTMLMPPRYRDAHLKGLERIRTTGESQVLGGRLELYGLNKGGDEFPIEMSLSRSIEANEVFYCGIIRDITDRKRAELDLEERNRLLTLDAEVGRILNQEKDSRTLLQGCTEALVKHLDAAFARIWTLRSKEQVLELQASAGLYTHLNGPHSRVPVGHLKIGQIVVDKKPLLTNSVIGDARIPEQEWAQREGLVAFAGYPLLSGSHVVGVMALFARRPLTEFTLKSLGMVADRITTAIERQRATEAQQKLAELNERILASAGEGIFGLDLEGKTTFVNPAGAKSLGYTVDELIGKPMLTLTHRATPEGTVLPGEESPLYTALKDGTVYQGDNEVLWRKDNTSFPIEYTSTPIREEDRLIGTVVTFQDITERKRAQEAHHKVCEQMEKTLTSLPGSIFVVEQGQRVIYANAEASQHFEKKGSQLLGRFIHDVLPFTSAEWTGLVEKFTWEYTQTGRNPYQDLEFESQDRTYRYSLFPILFEDIETARTGLVVWDISEQKKLQTQLIQSEKLSCLGTFVAGMVHEVRSPMQAILGMADLILDEDKPETITELAQDIKRVSSHITTILSDFMIYARPGSGKPVDVDLNDRLMESLKMVQRGLDWGTVEVEHRFDTLPLLSMRQGEIDQVLINLMANAVQAMKGRGRLILATQYQDEMVTARISDTGCGIPPEALKKIFDPFFSTKGKGKGTGLGLSIVQQIVVRNGGQISVDSVEGQGTTFTIQFPVSSSLLSPEA